MVHQALLSLSSQFSQIKTTYKTYNHTWDLNELISKYVVEEEKLEREKNEFAYITSQNKANSSFNKGMRKKFVDTKKTQNFNKYEKVHISR